MIAVMRRAFQLEGSPALEGEGSYERLGLFLKTAADHIVVEHNNPSDWRRFAQRSFDDLRMLMSGPTEE